MATSMWDLQAILQRLAMQGLGGSGGPAMPGMQQQPPAIPGATPGINPVAGLGATPGINSVAGLGATPPGQMPQPQRENILQRMRSGMGGRLFPGAEAEAAGFTPQQVKALQQQAMTQMAMGLIGNVGSGRGLGQGLMQGYDYGQRGLGQQVEQRVRSQSADEQRRRQQEQRDYERARDTVSDERWRAEQEATRTWREQQAKIDREQIAAQRDQRRREDVPSGYRLRADRAGLEPIPGGPADPAGPAMRKVTAPLRKEFRGLQSVKDYETVLPLYESAKKAPDSGYGDLQLIYTVGKVLDPGSVVREGELALTIKAGSPLQRVLGATRFTTERGGRLTAQTRQQIMAMLEERITPHRQAYERDFNQYGQYARDLGLNPEDIIGSHASSAYAQQSPAGAPSNVIDVGATLGGARNTPQLGIDAQGRVIQVDY